MKADNFSRQIKPDSIAFLCRHVLASVESLEYLMLFSFFNSKSVVFYKNLCTHFILLDYHFYGSANLTVFHGIIQNIIDCFSEPVGIMRTVDFLRQLYSECNPFFFCLLLNSSKTVSHGL